VARYRATLHPD